MATHTSILAEKSHGQKSLVGYSPNDCNESDKTEQLSKNTRQSLDMIHSNAFS